MLKHTVLAEAHEQKWHTKAEVQALKQALPLSEHAAMSGHSMVLALSVQSHFEHIVVFLCVVAQVQVKPHRGGAHD